MKAHLALVVLTCLWLVSPTEAQDFRVETDVYAEDEKQPVTETLTLFSGDVVYDFMLTDPREVAVFDVRRGRIVLLDQERKVRTTLTTDELLQFSAAIRARSSRREDQQLFGTEFAGHLDEETGEVVLDGGNLVYRAKGLKPKLESATERYRQFADWYARLNAARPGNPPPFGRLELNRRLAHIGVVPEEIARSLRLPGRFRDEKRTATSRHTFTWLLSTTDRKRIEDAGSFMASYEQVKMPEYFGVQ